MAENKKSFLLYCDIIHTVRKLPKDKVADLFLHILAYVNDENPTTDDMILEIAFEPVKQALKRDLVKYEKILERNRNNGKSGGRPRKEPKKPIGLNVNPKNPDEPKKADSDSDIDIYNNLTVNWDKLLSQFNQITGKKSITISDKVKRSFKARLKEGYSKQNIVDAITNCFNDDYHIETNHKYLTLEFISRSDKMEKYCSLKPSVSKIKKEEIGKL